MPLIRSPKELTTAELEEAFAAYLEEIERCTKAHCYWSLLHLLVILPDICAALESNNGKASREKYRNWCERYFGQDIKFTSIDRYALRCALLHQGRTVTNEGQYGSYSFVQPTPAGDVIHRLVQDFGPQYKRNFILDVSRMAVDSIQAIRSWFADIQNPTNAPRLQNVRQHIRWLARKGEKVIPGTIINTFATTSSTGGF